MADNDRKLCEICGCEIPKRKTGQRGPPQRLCNPDTGRDCRRYSKRLAECQGLIASIIARTPSANRSKAVHRIRDGWKQALIEIRDPVVDR